MENILEWFQTNLGDFLGQRDLMVSAVILLIIWVRRWLLVSAVMRRTEEPLAHYQWQKISG